MDLLCIIICVSVSELKNLIEKYMSLGHIYGKLLDNLHLKHCATQLKQNIY